MSNDDALSLPKVAATLTLTLYEDGNMSIAFSGTLADVNVCEHMLKKALQGVDDEKFNAYLTAKKGMEALVKTATPAALNGHPNVNLGKRLHG